MIRFFFIFTFSFIVHRYIHLAFLIHQVLLSIYTYYNLLCVFTQGRPRSLGELMCGVRTYPNKSQLLPILSTKAKYVRDNTTVYCRYFVLSRSIFRVCTAADTASASCVSRFFCTDAGTASIPQVFRPLALIVFVLRVLAVPKYSQYAQ